MSSESDGKKPGDADAGDADPGSTVALKVEDVTGDAPRPATPPAEAAPTLATAQPADELPVLPAAVAEPGPSTSGSIDVSVSSPVLPASASGSVDVSLTSSTAIPQAVAATDSQRFDSQPVSSSGAVAAVVPPEGTGPARRAKRVTAAVQDVLSGGVEKLGAGIGAVGEVVTTVGDLTKKVPLVGPGVGKLGEGITRAGESIHALPQVTKTRRGRLLVRSVVVGFLIVASWISVIVWFQLRAHDTPDFRPEAERILLELGKGSASVAQVYERASPRFQEIVRKERFLDDMADMFATNGRFREITAINETVVTTGPTGRVGRVGLTALFENGVARGSISFHWDRGQWKLLGLGIELPADIAITQTERQKRVAACIDDKGDDVSDQRRKCDVRDAAETILELVREGRAGEVWDGANAVFKQQESRARFIQIQDEQRAALGNYKRLLTITDARAIGGVSATFDVVAEFERASGVRVEFDFTRASKFERWQLARFKVAVPMPRANEVQLERPPASTVPGDAGVRDGGAPDAPARR